MNVNTEINRGLGWSIALSVLMIAAGIMAIIMPPVSGIAVTILVAWLVVFFGGAHMAYAWHARSGGGLWWGILLGIICIIAGGYLLLHPMLGLASLTLVLAGYLLVESTLEFILAFELRALSGSGWLLFDGIISLIFAIMIWRTWPFSTMWVIGTLVGISMIFTGVARLMISVAARRIQHAISVEQKEAKQAH